MSSEINQIEIIRTVMITLKDGTKIYLDDSDIQQMKNILKKFLTEVTFWDTLEFFLIVVVRLTSIKFQTSIINVKPVAEFLSL